MTTTTSPPSASTRPLRVWPGVVAIVALLAARFGVKAVVPGFEGFATGMMWSFGGAGAVLLWWLLASRARWYERLGGVVLMAVGLGAAWQLRHESMGPLWLVGYALPLACVGLVAGATAARRLPEARRRAVLAAAILASCLVWTLVRTEGISGDHVATFHWRWMKSPEERLLARGGGSQRAAVSPRAASPSVAPSPAASDATVATAPPPAAGAGAGARPAPGEPEARATPTGAAATITAPEWPGFRGPRRDGTVRGVRIETDWSASPPVELWRRPVGPGWSSFAVDGRFLYTQEQRGEREVVACYDATTGEPVWAHEDTARFVESNAGPGPRGTPTLSGGRLYAFGATGILNALEAGTGTVVWSRDASADAKGTRSMGGALTKVPDWGFSSSPLAVDDLVIVAVAGQLIAYDRDTGNPRWSGPEGGGSYSSPHLATIAGERQVLLLSSAGATGVRPDNGQKLWDHAWRGLPIVQPGLTAEGDVLISAHATSGMRRLAISPAPGGWTAAERWTTSDLKPYFNDFVVHEGHAYGFDGRILACIDLRDGRRKWKGGRYGNGQLLLLAEQGLLLVLSEEGDLALVDATPGQFRERARQPALQGKTWNHPVLASDLLLVRNGEEMAAFRLPVADRTRPTADLGN